MKQKKDGKRFSMSNNTAILKYNGGNLAILCSKCRVIIKTGAEFTKEEREFALGKGHLPPQYCKECKLKIP